MRTTMTGVSLAALTLGALTLAACGRNDADQAAAGGDGVEIVETSELGAEELAPAEQGDGAEREQVAELAPPAEPAPPPAPAADRPLTLDLGSEYAEITVTLPAEAAGDAALYDLLREQAETEAREAREIAAEDKVALEEIDVPFNPHTLEIEWSATFASDDVLSLLKTTYVFQGGAHPNAYFDAVNWRRDAHAEFGIGDMLTADAWAALSPAAEQALMAQKRERLGDGLTDEEYWREDIIYATGPSAENFALFTLVPSASDAVKAGGIALHYAPYAVGPYAEGDYHIVIPQDVFAAYVAPDFADVFAGEPAAN